VSGGLGDKERQVGQQVQRVRSRLGLSQHQLAERMKPIGPQYAKWRQSTIYKIEHGEKPLRVNEMFDLAGALGVPPETLLAFDIDAAVLESQIQETEELLKQAQADHDEAVKHLQAFYDRSAHQRSMMELAERDTALRTTRFKATLEVLYRLRANLSKGDG
jgi:transcriptional regulator with XRE-family HTH domain